MSYLGADLEYVEVDKVLKDTGRAILCRLGAQEREVWIPWSVVCEDDSEVEGEGDSGVVAVAQWFAKREGLS